MNEDPVEAIARAVLYQGYVLWPYRSSARRSRQQVDLGGLYPPGFCSTTRQGDRWALRCECLVEGSLQAEVSVEVRFLHLVRRQVLQRMREVERPVDELRAGGELFLTWDETVERRVAVPSNPLGELAAAPRSHVISVPGGGEREAIRGDREERAGTLHRTWEALDASLRVQSEPMRRGLHRLRVEVVNNSTWSGLERGEAQRHALLSTHLLLKAPGGRFVSATSPPQRLKRWSSECRNDGLWPVLVGEPGSGDRMLAAPTHLEDYPGSDPRSPRAASTEARSIRS